MVPIHDTDVSEERWLKTEWENYELWEKVEQRLKRKKRLWIFVTFTLFMVLSAVPVTVDRWPKWQTRTLSRRLAQEINQIKKNASLGRTAFRLSFPAHGTLTFVVERVDDCKSLRGTVVRSGDLDARISSGKNSLVPPERSAELGIPGLVNSFCYDSFTGSEAATQGESVVGFAIIPVKDLTENRMDRLTVLLISGASAEISFD